MFQPPGSVMIQHKPGLTGFHLFEGTFQRGTSIQSSTEAVAPLFGPLGNELSVVVPHVYFCFLSMTFGIICVCGYVSLPIAIKLHLLLSK